MNERLSSYLDGVFAPYDGVKSASELKADLLSDLQERFNDLKAEGKDDDMAFQMTIDGIGDIEQTVLEVANLSRSLERQVARDFSTSNLPQTDFAGVVMHNGRFSSSKLRGSNFAGADLTGSSLSDSDVREANFDGTNLTDCNLSYSDLAGASFRQSILVRTKLEYSGLMGTRFIDVRLTDVNLTITDLKATVFENCVFDGVDFSHADLRDLCLDGMTFRGGKFDHAALAGATFRGATLINVSFLWARARSRRLRTVKVASFEGAKMDKLTYATLKGLGADLTNVTIIPRSEGHAKPGDSGEPTRRLARPGGVPGEDHAKSGNPGDRA